MSKKGDYSADKITTSDVGKTVQDVLNEYESLKNPDTELSSGSTRPVQNKVISEAIDKLTARSLPEGGNAGDILTKQSNANFDARWTDSNVYMKKSEYDRNNDGKVDRADTADSVQGPGSYKARLKTTTSDTYLLTEQDKGATNGVVPLDETKKIPLQYLPDNLMNGLVRGGTFDATTRVITLSNAAKDILHTTDDTIVLEDTSMVPSGYPTDAEMYYIVTEGGTFAGMTFSPGDWLFSLGSWWKQLVNGNQVSSVNGQTGAVDLDSDDVPQGVDHLYMTQAERTKLQGIEEQATRDLNVVQKASIVYSPTGDKILKLENKNGTITEFEGKEIDESQYLKKTGDASETTVSYGIASTRTGLPGGGTLRENMELIRRWLNDLKSVALTGKYGDLVDEPTKLSQFLNDGNGNPSLPFITKDTDVLVNYYKKADTYTKREIDNIIAALGGHSYIEVETLPTTDIDETAIYYVPIREGGAVVGYNRYQRIGNRWAFLGSTDVNMNEYLKKDGDGSNVTSSINQTSSRLSLSDGDTLSVALGKIAKWLADLNEVAFTGSFNSLTDTEDVVLRDELDDYVQKNFGMANAGRILVVGQDGKVTTDAAKEGATRKGSGEYSVVGNDASDEKINDADGERSTAFGDHTIAKGAAKFVAGKYNRVDNANIYVEQIGGGDVNTRSDLRNTTWEGHGWYKNGVSVGNTTDNIIEPTESNDLTTKIYVDRTIEEEIAKSDRLRAMVVNTVPDLQDAESNVLYLVPDPTSEGHYLQYKKVLKSQNPDVYEMANLGGTQLTLESTQVERLPEASEAYKGKVYQYIGNSSAYKFGANYACMPTQFYGWIQESTAKMHWTDTPDPKTGDELGSPSGYGSPIYGRQTPTSVFHVSTYIGPSEAYIDRPNRIRDSLANWYTRDTSGDTVGNYHWVPLFTKLSDFTTDGAEITTVADDTNFSSVDLEENKINRIPGSNIFTYIWNKMTGGSTEITTIGDNTKFTSVDTTTKKTNYMLGSKIFTYIWSKIKGSKWTNTINADNQGSDVIPSASAVYNSIGKRILVNQYSVPDAGQTVAQVLTSAGLNIAGGYACAYVRNTAKISNRPFIDGGAVYVEVIARDTTTRIVRWTNWVGERSMTCSQTNGTWSSWYETGGGTVTEGTNDYAISYSTPTSQGLKITGNYSSAMPPRVWKMGKIVNLSFHCVGTATAIGAGWTTIGVVGANYRPKYQIPITAMIYDAGSLGNQSAGGYINTGGSVVLWTNAKTTTNNYQVRVNVTYITN